MVECHGNWWKLVEAGSRLLREEECGKKSNNRHAKGELCYNYIIFIDRERGKVKQKYLFPRGRYLEQLLLCFGVRHSPLYDPPSPRHSLKHNLFLNESPYAPFLYWLLSFDCATGPCMFS